MTPREVIELRFKPVLLECEQHLVRLHYAAAGVAGLFPLDPDGYAGLADQQVSLLDQMLFRFGKLQDAMGQRLFPALLQAGQEWQARDTFLDRLNRLEQLGAIASAEDWLRLRELRNNAMHEYPDQPDLNAVNLNRIHGSVPDLGRALALARAFAAERFGL